MRDADGTIWVALQVSEQDRDALAIARRLVMRAIDEEGEDASVWRNGAGAVEPRAVLINLDRLVEEWDGTAESE